MNYVCPCTIADEPCHPDCSCVKIHMSRGCLCCATYGSPEQRKAAANRIVQKIRDEKESPERQRLREELNSLSREFRELRNEKDLTTSD